MKAVRGKWMDYEILTRILSHMGYNVLLQANSTMFKRPEGMSPHDNQLFHDTQTAIVMTITN